MGFKIIDDTLKEKGRWSRSSLMIFFTFWSNLVFVGLETIKSGKYPDLPSNWLALIVFLYGINKGATAVNNQIAKGVQSDTGTVS